jgi:hypothetical protein
MRDYPREKVPSDIKTIRSIRRGPNDKISNFTVLDHFNGWPHRKIPKIPMTNLPKLHPIMMPFLPNFQLRLILLPQIKPGLVPLPQINKRMNLLHDLMKTRLKAVVFGASLLDFVGK